MGENGERNRLIGEVCYRWEHRSTDPAGVHQAVAVAVGAGVPAAYLAVLLGLSLEDVAELVAAGVATRGA